MTTSFTDLGLSEPLLKALNESGYTHPTAIQEKAIPQVLMGKDILGIAQTGTGKTGAFAMPILDILSQGRSKPLMPRAIILEPTRELAQQVEQNFAHYSKYMNLKTALVVGGSFDRAAGNQFARGVDIIIATPGRLLDIIERGQIMLNAVQILTLDECDRMLDMGFVPDIEKLVKMLPANRQNLLLSATIPNEIRAIADRILVNPKEIAVSAAATTAVNITQSLIVVQETDKRKALRHLLRTDNVQNAFIFCNRKRDVDTLFKSLQKHGFAVGALHGDMEQDERYATLNKFKANELNLLVCSDVAARGIDISDVPYVFNFDVPFSPDDYVHRIGRTGRAGKSGTAYMLATPFDGLLVKAIEELTKQTLPRLAIPDLQNEDLITNKAELKDRKKAAPARPAGRERKARPNNAAAVASEENSTRVVKERPVREDQPASERPKRERKSREPQTRERPASNSPTQDYSAQERPPREKFEKQNYSYTPGEPYKRSAFVQDDMGPAPLGFGDEVPAFLRGAR